jgi:hypothetical protein
MAEMLEPVRRRRQSLFTACAAKIFKLAFPSSDYFFPGILTRYVDLRFHMWTCGSNRVALSNVEHLCCEILGIFLGHAQLVAVREVSHMCGHC